MDRDQIRENIIERVPNIYVIYTHIPMWWIETNDIVYRNGIIYRVSRDSTQNSPFKGIYDLHNGEDILLINPKGFRDKRGEENTLVQPGIELKLFHGSSVDHTFLSTKKNDTNEGGLGIIEQYLTALIDNSEAMTKRLIEHKVEELTKDAMENLENESVFSELAENIKKLKPRVTPIFVNGYIVSNKDESVKDPLKEILGDEYFRSNVHLTDMYDYIPFAEREKLKHLGKESL